MRVGVVAPGITAQLRRRVLRPGWSPDRVMPGDTLPDAVHFAAQDGERVVGAALLTPTPAPVPSPGPSGPGWQLRGMAVEPALQGSGIGRLVVAAIVEYVAARGGGLLWCNARESAIGFYRRLGFGVVSEPFLHAETGIPHAVMTRRVDPSVDAARDTRRT